MIAHNGEVNTLRGNVNWMRARESQLASELFGEDLHKVIPVVQPGGSDSATFDNVLELLVLSGRSIPHAMMMMVPEAYRTRKDLDPDVKGFYDFHSCLMEPWDGPAAVVFTDGRLAGAVLDRNGLRPGRWIQDTEGYVVLASETGVITVAPEHVQRKGRLAPGKVFLLDLEEGKIVDDERGQAPASRAAQALRRVVQAVGRRTSTTCPTAQPQRAPDRAAALQAARVRLLAGGSAAGDRADGGQAARSRSASMGNDAALAVMSDRQPPLFSLLQAAVRAGHQPADRPDPRVCRDEPADRRRRRDQPALRGRPSRPTSSSWTSRSCATTSSRSSARSPTTCSTRPRSTSPGRSSSGARRDGAAAGRRSARRPPRYVDNGANILILSDRNLGPERVAMPVAAGCRRRASPPRAARHAPAHRARDRVRRAAGHPSHGDADRLWRRGDQPVPDVRVPRRARGPVAAAGRPRPRGGARSGSSRRSARAC